MESDKGETIMSERFIVDTAGTLIDMETRNTYDYVGDVVGLLNKFNEENEQLKKENKKLNCIIKQLEEKYEDKGFSLAYDMGECE